jgi:hypothetical protein
MPDIRESIVMDVRVIYTHMNGLHDGNRVTDDISRWILLIPNKILVIVDYLNAILDSENPKMNFYVNITYYNSKINSKHQLLFYDEVNS